MYACNNCGKEGTKTGSCERCQGDIIRTRRDNPEIAARRQWFRTILSRAEALREAKTGFKQAGGVLVQGTPGTSG